MLVQALLQAPRPSVGAGIIAVTWHRRSCRRYYRPLAPMLVQMLLQALGRNVGPGIITDNLDASMIVKLLVHIPTFNATQNSCV